MPTPNDYDWFSPVETPIDIEQADDLDWQASADVVVVGFGGAGASAAIAAVDQGASVIAIDRYDGGGATAISGGIVYMGGGTEQQQEAGVEDTPEAMFNYLKMETGGVIEDETLKRFCDDSVDMERWLIDNGVEFDANLSPVKTSYPSNDYFLYYSGNEAVAEYAEQAKPAQRGHRAFGSGLSGSSFYEPLKASALSKGVQLLSQSRAHRLVQDASGRIVGLEVYRIPPESPAAKQHAWLSRLAVSFRLVEPVLKLIQRRLGKLEEQHAQPERVRANKGVILSTGGFIHNREMVNHYAPKYSPALPLGKPSCDGSGIYLGMSAGGATDRMERVSAWRFINPPLAWAQGIVVNDDGKRYCNEQVYGAKLGYHMVEENNGRALLIVDRELFWQATKQSMPWKIWMFQAMPALMNLFLNAKKGNSIEELAERCDLPVENLQATVEAYNRAAAGEQEDELRKSPEFIKGLFSGPYYAMDISVDSTLFPLPTITVGGLVVNEKTGQVKNDHGDHVEGLYAAGRAAVGVASHFYMSGLSIADCVFSGKRAGQHSAES